MRTILFMVDETVFAVDPMNAIDVTSVSKPVIVLTDSPFFDIPKLDGPIGAGRTQIICICLPGKSQYVKSVPLEYLSDPIRLSAQKFRHLFRTATCKSTTIRRIDQTKNGDAMRRVTCASNRSKKYSRAVY